MRTILGLLVALSMVLVVCLALVMTCEQPRAPETGNATAFEMKEMLLPNVPNTGDTLAITGTPCFAVLRLDGATALADEQNCLNPMYDEQAPSTAVVWCQEVAITLRTCYYTSSSERIPGMMIPMDDNAIGRKRGRTAI